MTLHPVAAGTGAAGPLPILYSFRRCPYAIRARLALSAAGFRPGFDLELREVSLKAKPAELLAASTKGTVPMLVLPGGEARQPAEPGDRSASPPYPGRGADTAQGLAQAEPPSTVLEESLPIMRWALDQRDPPGWNQGWNAAEREQIVALIGENDGPFKRHLDRFKYAARYGEAGLREQPHHRQKALAILRSWAGRLQTGGWLLGERPSLADIALLPFVRQFHLSDPQALDQEPGLAALQQWLMGFLASPELATVMTEPWGCRRIWPSSRRLYHLALAEEWRSARAAGVYTRSTRDLSLQEVGFIHASHSHQLQATWRRFYADAGKVVLLHIDPERLADAGVPVRLEPAPGSGELFPHLYGALPLEAVVLVEDFLL